MLQNLDHTLIIAKPYSEEKNKCRLWALPSFSQSQHYGARLLSLSSNKIHPSGCHHNYHRQITWFPASQSSHICVVESTLWALNKMGKASFNSRYFKIQILFLASKWCLHGWRWTIHSKKCGWCMFLFLATSAILDRIAYDTINIWKKHGTSSFLLLNRSCLWWWRALSFSG